MAARRSGGNDRPAVEPVVPMRELRNHTHEVIDRLTDHGSIAITSRGVPVARLSAIDDTRPRFIRARELAAAGAARRSGHADDAAYEAWLADLAADRAETTDQTGDPFERHATSAR